MSRRLKRDLFIKSKIMNVPVSGTFELTKRCNLNCRMCYIHDRKTGRELDAETWIQFGKEACEQGMFYLLLTGGEPFAREDFPYIYEELSKLGLRISVNTNGTLLNDEIVNVLKTYPPERINLTMYGASGETYQCLCGYADGYQKMRENLGRIKEEKLPLAVNTTFSRLNIEDMGKIIEIAKEEQVPVRMASYLFPPLEDSSEDFTLTPEEMGASLASFEQQTLPSEYVKKRQDYIRNLKPEKNIRTDDTIITGSKCMAGCGAFWISYDGQMYPCGMLRDGVSVVDHGFLDAWNKVKEKACQMVYPKECLTCPKKKLCPFCQAVLNTLDQDMTKVRTYLCAQTDAYIKRHQDL